MNLNEKHFKISDINDNSNKFILLDFWGTWCKPCIKLTPELKRINNKLSEKLTILSIAYDKDINSVKDYISKNNITWPQAFENRNIKGKIIKELKIISYPTFILIDKSGKIIYRGGTESLSEIESIIENKSDYLE